MSTRKKPWRRNYKRELAAVTQPGSLHPAGSAAPCEWWVKWNKQCGKKSNSLVKYPAWRKQIPMCERHAAAAEALVSRNANAAERKRSAMSADKCKHGIERSTVCDAVVMPPRVRLLKDWPFVVTYEDWAEVRSPTTIVLRAGTIGEYFDHSFIWPSEQGYAPWILRDVLKKLPEWWEAA